MTRRADFEHLPRRLFLQLMASAGALTLAGCAADELPGMPPAEAQEERPSVGTPREHRGRPAADALVGVPTDETQVRRGCPEVASKTAKAVVLVVGLRSAPCE